jgi:hypothetical protein
VKERERERKRERGQRERKRERENRGRMALEKPDLTVLLSKGVHRAAPSL